MEYDNYVLRKQKSIMETRYQDMDCKDFDSWLQRVKSKLLWFSYRDLLDIAAKFTSLHGQQQEYPQTLVEALDITRKIERAKAAKRKKAQEKAYQGIAITEFPEPPNLREEDCCQGQN